MNLEVLRLFWGDYSSIFELQFSQMFIHSVWCLRLAVPRVCRKNRGRVPYRSPKNIFALGHVYQEHPSTMVPYGSCFRSSLGYGCFGHDCHLLLTQGLSDQILQIRNLKRFSSCLKRHSQGLSSAKMGLAEAVTSSYWRRFCHQWWLALVGGFKHFH